MHWLDCLADDTGTKPCNNPTIQVPHTRLTCTLSPGVGNNVTVVVARAAQSASKPCVTFKGPIITQGTLKFQGGPLIITGGVANIVAPNTKGGQIVEFQG